MAQPSWQCPYCLHYAVVTVDVRATNEVRLMDSSDGPTDLSIDHYVCPNPKCRRMSLSVLLRKLVKRGNLAPTVVGSIQYWRLRPSSRAKPQPDYIPQQIRSDYEEACLICDLSPKASATLSRRCLQGIIRDFHGIARPKLAHAIDAIQDMVDADMWGAIDAVRRVGNIGAHMEQDVNVIVDVEPEEAELLTSLIEQLFREWYVWRHQRQQKLGQLKAIAEEKERQRREGKEQPSQAKNDGN